MGHHKIILKVWHLRKCGVSFSRNILWTTDGVTAVNLFSQTCPDNPYNPAVSDRSKQGEKRESM